MTPPDEPRNLPEDFFRQRPDDGQPAQSPGPSSEQPPPAPNPYEPTAPYAQQQPPYGGPPVHPAGYGQQPYGQPGYGYGYGVPVGAGAGQQHPSATTALVLGIVGLAGIVFCAGITLVLSPFAWAIGRRAVREIDAEPGRYAGRDQAKGGQIMGIIGTVLLVLGIVAIVGLLSLAFAASSDAEFVPSQDSSVTQSS